MQRFLWKYGIRMGKTGLKALVDKVDADQDGRIEYTEFFEKLGLDPKMATDPAEKKGEQRWQTLDAETVLAHQTKNPVGLEALNRLRFVLKKQGTDPSKLRQVMLAFRRTLAIDSVDDSVDRSEFKQAIRAVRQLRLNEERVKRAIQSAGKQLRHPAVFISYDVLRRLGKIAAHEEARALGELVVVDTFDQLMDFTKEESTLFVSHQARARDLHTTRRPGPTQF